MSKKDNNENKNLGNIDSEDYSSDENEIDEEEQKREIEKNDW